MSTIPLEIAETLKQHNGVFPGDEHLPPVTVIVEYLNNWGTLSYKMLREGQRLPEESDFFHRPRVWWSRGA